MDSLDAATLDTVLSSPNIPDDFASIAGSAHCQYAARLDSGFDTFVVDFEIDEGAVDFSDELMFERLSDFTDWLRGATAEHLRTPSILLNVGIKH